jgi:hypothetical protein
VRSVLPLALALLPAPLHAEGPSFAREVAPLLTARCVGCHSGKSPRGGLDLTTRQGLLAGGDRGPVVVPGKADDSPLVTRARAKEMPPKQPLADAEADLLARWVAAGAAWEGGPLRPPRAEVVRAGPDWWSLQPIRRPAVPAVKAAAWPRNPVDNFVLARLEQEGLTPSPEADRRAWLIRVSIDLTGLRPTAEDRDAFLADKGPDAFEKVVDRLLASPAYGERWGLHWLDVVRFAESHGYEMNTLRPNAWPYRDYVIRAFNDDVPYPRFVREQLAGDQLGGDALSRAATGFLVAGPHDLVGNATPDGKAQQRADDLADLVGSVGATFLGLTVGCARCHDHKFDPITQTDFYALQAVFAGVEHADRPLDVLADGPRQRRLAELRAALARLEADADAKAPLAGPDGAPQTRPPVSPLRNVERFPPAEARFVRLVVSATNDGTQPCIDELEVYGADGVNVALAANGAKASASSEFPNVAIHKIAHLIDGRHGNGASWISNEPGKGWAQVELARPTTIDKVVWGRDREGQYADRLATTYRVEASPDGEKWSPVAGSWDRRPYRSGQRPTPSAEEQKLRQEAAELCRPQTVYAGRFRAPDPTFLLKRGDPTQRGEAVGPAAVASVGPPLKLPPDAPEGRRRLALADWIAHPDNPLPARVMVNRVWHGHFGQGIVRTPSDFGLNGDRPSHPELLDWLAAEYRENGYRLKPLHRLIVLSATYRQASRLDEKKAAVDAGNRLLWRVSPRRLEAEAIRDTILQASGALDRTAGGPGYHLWDYSGYVIVFTPRADPGPETFRRMVYQFKPRLQQDPVFGAFDCPDATTAAPRRNVSTTPLQALNLLNGAFIAGQAERFAARLRQEAGSETERQVERAFLLALNRPPSPREAEAAVKLAHEHGLALLCRALFNANEFVFID